MKSALFFAALLFSLVSGSAAQAQPSECPESLLRKLYDNSREDLTIDCNLRMQADSVIHKRLLIAGREASNIRIDCAGSRLERGLQVMSTKQVDARGEILWSVPTDVHVANCTTAGITHVFGMGRNGEGEDLTASSRREGHTGRVQANAPTRIYFDNFTTETDGAIAFYLGPGVTHASITNSQLRGRSKSVAIYLDAESGHNLIADNLIATDTGRELIAIDGSAHNQITGNRLNSLSKGGIYLYRNCGEGGNIRHQAPQDNRIANNRFYYDQYQGRNPSIWLGSRDGNRNYCHHDQGYALGSSADDGDFADNNQVVGNRFTRHMNIRDDGQHNRIQGNQVENPRPCLLFFCWGD